MKKMSAGKFKTHCLSVINAVQKTGEPVLITKGGRPIAKLVPAVTFVHPFLGRLEGIVKITGDIESPVLPAEAWDALR